MNKTVIKNFAVDAHKQLVEQIKVKAYQYGVTDNSCPELNTESINGKLLSDVEKSQLNALIKAVNIHGYNHVIEEVAYTWFNRFIALRYMEVNNNLPQRIRVFTNGNNEFKPEILAEAIHLDLEGLDKQKVFDFIDTNNQDELYKYLLLAICNDMNKYLPEMFTAFDQQNYKVLLIPDGLLKEDSVLAKLIRDIPEEDWKESNDGPSNEVTMIGWMYQYYISQRHNEVVNISKGTVSKEDISAATELFTTDWVVRYMVDNSLGRYWIERNPNSELKNKLKYLATGKDGSLPIVENDSKKPEEITFFDPCMGSGHILSYAFDVLMEIYRECGWRDKDAAVSIVENNLYGLDIDERAYQLAYFSIMMKGRLYNRRFLKSNVNNHLSNIVETNDLDSLSYFGMEENEEYNEISTYLLDTFKDALELGSLIEVETKDFESYSSYIYNIYNNAENTSDYYYWRTDKYDQIIKLIKQAKILSNKYCITTTNPPYLNKMSGELKKYVVKNYKAYSSDLFAVFIKRNFEFTVENGYLGFMTPFVWMFIKSYEQLRKFIISEKSIATLVQMEYSAYEEATVPICSFVLKNGEAMEKALCFRLSDFKGGMEIQNQKVLEAINSKNCGYFYETEQSNFSKIPGSPIAYWVSERIFNAFLTNKVDSVAFSDGQILTGDNNKFLRMLWEVDATQVHKDGRWMLHAKGGEYRKWSGNLEWVVKWSDDAINYYKTDRIARFPKDYILFRKGVTWSLVSTNPTFGARFLSERETFNKAAATILFNDEKYVNYTLALLNSSVVNYLTKIINPTLNNNIKDILAMPFVYNEHLAQQIDDLVDDNISIAGCDWDSFETSWDFKRHPLICYGSDKISVAFEIWTKECIERFNKLKENEEELNRLFIDVYGLQDELIPNVKDTDITVCKANLQREIKSLISYAVGCMFGRYSLNTEGLTYAGGDWDSSKYKTFIPDFDNIIPICDEEYFEDDIVRRFIGFISCIYGEDTLDENLQFISNALGGNGNPRDVLRDYFIRDFFKNHCKIYQKRPIYWLFDSGKKNGFKALVYIHRYTPDLIARMRTGYIHPLQSQYRTQIEMLNNQIDNSSSTSEKVKLKKKFKKITEQAEELGKYEEKIHHWADKMEPMDLDDGVKVNYAKFQELLAKIK
ncbi:MAG: BREX-1 system adenine-specific DNA-methyltransferase PglX [Catenibacterium mitsuokai]|nr:BREX-1 system adenine-specific DNA-methyltransferase PglX [Catenibacterium mitsuokai]MBN2931491.1 BREX-1 system adenine-specific DNA-methyltransferase PglX [Catenibacterium mitsuokai]